MLDTSKINYQYLEDALLNASGKVPLAERFRALFTLKNIGDDKSIDIAAKGKLLRIYAFAYCVTWSKLHVTDSYS